MLWAFLTTVVERRHPRSWYWIGTVVDPFSRSDGRSLDRDQRDYSSMTDCWLRWTSSYVSWPSLTCNYADSEVRPNRHRMCSTNAGELRLKEVKDGNAAFDGRKDLPWNGRMTVAPVTFGLLRRGSRTTAVPGSRSIVRRYE